MLIKELLRSNFLDILLPLSEIFPFVLEKFIELFDAFIIPIFFLKGGAFSCFIFEFDFFFFLLFSILSFFMLLFSFSK